MTLLSFYGITVPLSFIVGAALAKATNSGASWNSEGNRKRKRERDADDDRSDLDLDSDADCDSPPPKKARLTDSSPVHEVDISLGETTFVESDSDVFMDKKSSSGEMHKDNVVGHHNKFVPGSACSEGGTPDRAFIFFESSNGDEDTKDISPANKPVDPRFDFNASNACVKTTGSPDSFFTPSPSSLSPQQSSSIKFDSYDPTDARHEWELRWFVCAHHAAFTAATAMSLRREIRRRKTLSRMWRTLKNENAQLKEEIDKLTLECHGVVEVQLT